MTDFSIKRRTLLQAALAGTLLPACKQSTPDKPAAQTPKTAPAKPKASAGRVVVLGFDGVDPRLVERFIQAGRLPELARLAKQGGFSPLASTSPPNSPVAWSTFASGRDPSEHGVFGFLKRDPRTYLPGTAPYTVTGPRFRGAAPTLPRAVSHRVGRAWWETLDAAGVPVGLLFVPYAFPPPDLKHGRVLSGLGVPDARFTNSSFTYFTSEPGDQDRVAGGRIVRLSPTGSAVETKLEGPRGPGKTYLSVPLKLELDRKAGGLTISLGRRTERLAEGARSDWFPVRFTADTPTGPFALAGRVRFHLIGVREELKLYATPIQLDPGQPMLPLGAPTDWAVEAVRTHSLPTVGWVHDTSAVNAGVLPKPVFLGSILDTMRARCGLLEAELDAKATKVQVGVFTGTDRAAHIFYRELEQKDGGPLAQVYQEMDAIVGRVRKHLGPDDRLIVMSDHGFHPFDRMLHVNTWLETLGLFKRATAGKEIKFLRGVDWAATKAYALGNGQVYANLLGREAKGSVAPGQAQQAVLDKVSQALLAFEDPDSGVKPVRAVYPVAAKAAAGLKDRAPDLQIAFAPGWRSSWATSLGGAPTGAVTADNPKAWCGDHAASDVAITPGILLADRKPDQADPDLKDLSTSLQALAGLSPEGPGRKLWS